MKLTVKQLKRLLKEALEPIDRYIDAEKLGQIVPAALAAAQLELDEEDLETIWVMKNPPVPEEGTEEIDTDGSTFYRSWSETNESELAEWIAQNWDQISVDVNGQRMVILCGSDDDEYGYFWSNADQKWHNYAY